MCHADYFFEHNFYDFLIFLKRMLGFHSLSIYYKKRKVRFFLVENGTIFSSAPEVNFLLTDWLKAS